MPNSLSLIVPFYRNLRMLEKQLEVWKDYPSSIDIIVVDDGSPEPALSIMSKARLYRVQLYRIGVDIPWNRGGARNLGARMANTPWIVHIDIDHVLSAESAEVLQDFSPSNGHWYRFERYRRGAADETRKKDAIDPKVTYGPIKPHCDSYMVGRKTYWDIGGYDEDYSGCLGGGSPFLKQLEDKSKPLILPPPIHLDVYTRSVIADASDFSLSRDTSEYSRRRKEKERQGNTQAKNPIRFPWTRQL